MKTKVWLWLGLIAAAVWAVARAPLGVVPGLSWHFTPVTTWPQRPLNPDEWFLADSPLGLVAARLAGITTEVGFARLHLVVTVVALSALAAFVAHASRGGCPWQGARLAVLAPVSTVLLAWIGSYDAFTVLAWSVVLWTWWWGNRPALTAAGLLLGFQHLEHGLLGLGALALASVALAPLLPARLRPRRLQWVLLGLVIGRGLLWTIFLSQDVPLSGRTQWLGPNLRDWTVLGVNVGPVLLWSLFAGSWAIAIWVVLRTPAIRARLLLGGSLALGLVALALSADRPRVFIVVMAPALALATIAFARSGQSPSERRLVEAVVWLGPPLLFWGPDIANTQMVDSLITTAKTLIGP